MKVHLMKSPNPNKKYRVTGTNWYVDFGARGYSDYTKHKDPVRKQRYITRHKSRENWSNAKTAGFWSRWLLWEKPTLTQAKNFIKRKFGILIN